jgi:pyrroline-5-carboxylate reductase
MKKVASISKAKAMPDVKKLARAADIIILAVKPKDVAAVLGDIKDELDSHNLLISVAAGVTTRRIEKNIGRNKAVVRVMPNMPAVIGAGISAICKGTYATKKDLTITRGLFQSLGEVVEAKENLIDAVTAISGSGPAYFFYMVELLTKTAVELGLKRDIADKLAIETAFGSAKILKETKEAPEILRQKVTSKGGTTEAAFKEFAKGGLEKILKKGIKRACERSKEL